MRKKRAPLFIILSLTIVLLLVSTVYAGNIKNRMKNRLPSIVALKQKGVIGETNRGYLAFVGKARENAAVVQAENKDRRTVYSAIAKQQGVSTEVVEKRRAIQIAKQAGRGQWLQDKKGQWYQKK